MRIESDNDLLMTWGLLVILGSLSLCTRSMTVQLMISSSMKSRGMLCNEGGTARQNSIDISDSS